MFVHNYEELEEEVEKYKKLQGQGFSIFRGTIIGFACIIIILSWEGKSIYGSQGSNNFQILEVFQIDIDLKIPF